MNLNVDRALQRAGELVHSNWLHAVHILQESAQENPQDARLQAALGDIFVEKQQYDKAVQFYLMALSLDPLDQHLPGMIANCYLTQNEYRLALAYYNRIIEPNDDILYSKALTLGFLGRSAEAVEILEAILPRYANHPLVYYLLVEQCYFSKEPAKALKYALMADKHTSEHFQRHILTAIIYYEMGNKLLAYNYYKRADELKPMHRTDHLIAYARAALDSGLSQNALSIAERILKINPKQSEAWELIIRYYMDQNDLKSARHYRDKATKHIENIGPGLRLIGKMLDLYR